MVWRKHAINILEILNITDREVVKIKFKCQMVANVIKTNLTRFQISRQKCVIQNGG